MDLRRFKLTTSRVQNHNADIVLQICNNFFSFNTFNIRKITKYIKNNKKIEIDKRPLSENFITIYKN
jgi:hypothetical protein